MRKHVGHDLLWLPSVSAVVRNDAGELLLGKRADDGRWSVVSGVVDPGEQPATAVVREVREETGVDVEPVRLASVVSHPYTYPNGDRCEYLNLGFECRWLGGTARVNDDESEAVEWFPPDRLPDLDAHARLVIAQALAPAERAYFLPVGAVWDDHADVRRPVAPAPSIVARDRPARGPHPAVDAVVGSPASRVALTRMVAASWGTRAPDRAAPGDLVARCGIAVPDPTGHERGGVR